MSIPPPMPCTTRKVISEPMFHAAPAATDPARNSESENSHVRLAPKRASAHPLNGITIP
jgi:hypothetical protein